MSRKISQKRLDANRRNAQKSTGPRTPEGKAKASANATTHGLSSPRGNPLAPGTLLHTEDPSAFQALLDEYVVTYPSTHHASRLPAARAAASRSHLSITAVQIGG